MDLAGPGSLVARTGSCRIGRRLGVQPCSLRLDARGVVGVSGLRGVESRGLRSVGASGLRSVSASGLRGVECHGLRGSWFREAGRVAR